jgi:hypothetical protein
MVNKSMEQVDYYTQLIINLVVLNLFINCV